MTRSVELALSRLRDRLARRGVLDVAERIAAHHLVTLSDVFTYAPVADTARRDIARALHNRGISMMTMGEWFAADLSEVFDLLRSDADQRERIAAALGLRGVA